MPRRNRVRPYRQPFYPGVEALEARLTPDGTASALTIRPDSHLVDRDPTRATDLRRIGFPVRASDDSYRVVEDSILTVAAPGVLRNDLRPSGVLLSASLATNPAHGSVTLAAGGSFVYQPEAGFTGHDSFTYVAADGRGGRSTGTVRIRVNADDPNHPPVPRNDSFHVQPDTTLDVSPRSILDNDIDRDRDDLSVRLNSGPSHGRLSLNADGTFTYTPAQGFVGRDQFTYTVSDGTATGRRTGVVRLNVAPASPPVADTNLNRGGGQDSSATNGGETDNKPTPNAGNTGEGTKGSTAGNQAGGTAANTGGSPGGGAGGGARSGAETGSPGGPGGGGAVNPTPQGGAPLAPLPSGPAVPSGLTTTLGVFDPDTATWYLRNAGTSGAPDVKPFAFGAPGWVPVVGDWDGDGTITVGAFDPATATFYLCNRNSAGAPDVKPFAFGVPGWVPVAGDWDGDGRWSVGVFDPATGTWYLKNRTTGGAPDVKSFRYGAAGWAPVVGDWDGNGTTTVGVFDPATAGWYLRNANTAGPTDVAPFRYGAAGWKPVAGDWDGNGTWTVGIFQPGNGRWFLRNTNTAGPADAGTFAYGAGGWLPFGGRYQPARGQTLLAQTEGPGGAALAAADLAAAAVAARDRLRAAGAAVAAVPVRVADLPGRALGLFDGRAVWIDADAAGHGWYAGAADPVPAGRADLLTAVLHELGHVLGLADLDSATHVGAAMADTLPAGTRRLDVGFPSP